MPLRPRHALFLLVVAAIALDVLHSPPVLVFFVAAAAIVPLAHLMGTATEELAARTGATIGGLMNATLGNAAELIIGIFALKAGLIDLVKASITGSIIGNLLLVLGVGEAGEHVRQNRGPGIEFLRQRLYGPEQLAVARRSRCRPGLAQRLDRQGLPVRARAFLQFRQE